MKKVKLQKIHIIAILIAIIVFLVGVLSIYTISVSDGEQIYSDLNLALDFNNPSLPKKEATKKKLIIMDYYLDNEFNDNVYASYYYNSLVNKYTVKIYLHYLGDFVGSDAKALQDYIYECMHEVDEDDINVQIEVYYNQKLLHKILPR